MLAQRVLVMPSSPLTRRMQDQTDAFKPSELPEWLYKTVSDALSVYEAAA